MKLWEKGVRLDEEAERYTAGEDYILDQALVRFDCAASIAHAGALRKCGVLSEGERRRLVRELRRIQELDSCGKFRITLKDEDVHTAIERRLVARLGALGKKIHTARSRNDQVAAAIRLFTLDRLDGILRQVDSFKRLLLRRASSHRREKMPGYTHARKAMPTTFGAWFQAFAESMSDNLTMLASVRSLISQNPLGTGAGYGISVFAIDRRHTARELGFDRVQESPLYVQNSRGKFEAAVVSALSAVMLDVNKMCTDLILFSMDEFRFVKLPREFCTGSSIMPQKWNPDVLEIARAQYHIVVANEFMIKGIIGNLMSGYNRDLQQTKKPLLQSLDITERTLSVITRLLEQIKVDEESCRQACTPEIYATEEAYRLVKSGVPFRDAYRKVAKQYAK